MASASPVGHRAKKYTRIKSDFSEGKRAKNKLKTQTRPGSALASSNLAKSPKLPIKEENMKKLLPLLFVFGTMAPAFANHPEMKDLSKDDRAKLAEVHEKMASCLRSDKPMKDCHDEMKKSCDEDKNCKDMMMHQMDHKKMMKKDK
jgi:hypothetical protein